MKTSRAWTFRTDASNTSTRGTAVVTPATVSDDQQSLTLIAFECDCGAQLRIAFGWSVFTCSYCGAVWEGFVRRCKPGPVDVGNPNVFAGARGIS